jgi:hypothetical protein
MFIATSIRSFRYLCVVFVLALSIPSYGANTLLDTMTILGDNDPLPDGPIFGVYVLAPFEGAVAMTDDDVEGYYPKLFLGYATRAMTKVGAAHAFMIAKLLGCSTSDEFCKMIYDNEEQLTTPGMGRFVGTFFKNYNSAGFVDTEFDDVPIAMGIHMAPFQSFKAFGQVSENMLASWQRRTRNQFNNVGEGCYLCTPMVHYDAGDTPYNDQGMMPARYQTEVTNQIIARRPDAPFHFHNTLGDHMFGWNESVHGQLYAMDQGYFTTLMQGYIVAAAGVAHRIFTEVIHNPNARSNAIRSMAGLGVGISPPNGRRRGRR